MKSVPTSFLLAVGLLVLPLVVSMVALLTDWRSGIVPWGDTALLELAVRDATHGDVLLGPYSRYHWHHPGPALFYGLALPYRMLGEQTAGLFAGAVLSAVLSLVVAAVIAFRRTGHAGAWWACVLASLYCWALGPEVLRVPWNPWITILPLLATVMLAWNAMVGRVWSFPCAAVLGSFIVQSHVGYAVVVATTLGVAGAAVVWHDMRTSGQRRRLAYVVLATVLLMAAAWALPLYQEATNNPGNISALAQFFSEARAGHTLSGSVEVALDRLGALPAQLVALSAGQIHRSVPPPWSGWVTVGALVVAIALAAWRRRPAVLHLLLLTVGFIVAAIVSATRIVGPVEDHLVLWMTGGSLLAWFAAGLAAMSEPGLQEPAPSPLRQPAALLLLALVALSVVNTRATQRAGEPEPWGRFGRPVVVTIADAVQRTLPQPGRGMVLVRTVTPDQWPVAAGVMVLLDRAGQTTRVQSHEAWLFGDQRVIVASDRTSAVVTIVDAASAARLVARGRTAVVTAGEMSVFVERPGLY